MKMLAEDFALLFASMRVYMCIQVCECTVRVYKCASVHMHTSMQVYMCVQLCECTCVYKCVCVRVYMCVMLLRLLLNNSSIVLLSITLFMHR